jgi:hypothetical protein
MHKTLPPSPLAALCFYYLHLMPTLQGQAVGKATIEVATERARLPGRRLILGHRHAARTRERGH